MTVPQVVGPAPSPVNGVSPGGAGSRPPGEPAASTASQSRPALLLAALMTAAGLVLAVLGFALATAPGAVRVALVVVGLIIFYAGARQLGRVFFGTEFDLGFWCALAWLVGITLAAILADVLPLPESLDPSKALLELPLEGPTARHWLGTDQYGLDLFGEIIYGARVSLIVGFGGVAIGGVIGTCVGLLAGYFRGRVDGSLGWVVDLILSFPPLVLLMALAAVLAPNTRNIALALAVLVVPSFARLARATTMKIAEQDYVFMAKAMGARPRRIMFREVLPNILPSLMSYALLVTAILIVAEASLSFLGLSVQRPTPTWGNLIAEAEPRFDQYPFLLAPAVPLFLTVFSINRIGDAIRARQARD
ncbi:ABC transporter permease [Micromonospora sp. NPDC005206]|uniref:ABC transporter permease n=1 Tax=Micromonospora sp. NPDC005206 TaxID=3157022 RepID=UPI0033BD2E8A